MKYCLSLILILLSYNGLRAQTNDMLIRISEIEVEERYLEEYKEILREEARASVELEPGVIAIFPMFQMNEPTQVRILEIYEDREAYESHLETPHFLEYKSSTLEMVKSLQLLDMEQIDIETMTAIFSKLKDTAATNLENTFQATPPATHKFGKEAFAASDKTTLRWLGMAGFLINSHGTTIMVDPLLKGFDMPILIEFPISTDQVPHLDAVLVTHSDNDHYSVPTNKDLNEVTKEFHSTIYVDSLMQNDGLTSFGHQIGASFTVGPVKVKMTPVDHAWQNETPGQSDRHFEDEDSAGFWIETPDGSIWATGDSRLMPEHLEMPTPDAILFDFSDSQWHFTLEGAVKLANAYPNTPLLLHHWGSVDAPDFTPFNADPQDLYGQVVNPERIIILAPGEPYQLQALE